MQDGYVYADNPAQGLERRMEQLQVQMNIEEFEFENDRLVIPLRFPIVLTISSPSGVRLTC